MDHPDDPRPEATEPKRRRKVLWSVLPALLAGFVAGIAGFALAPQLGVDPVDRGPGSIQGEPLETSDAADESETGTVNEIYEKVSPGVVHVTARVGGSPSIFGFGESRGSATGSGFVIDNKGHIVTNAHVVGGASEVAVSFSDEKLIDAEIVGQDPSTDLAVLKIDTPKRALVPLKFADSSKVYVGQPVVAIGNPFSLDRTVTSGIVSALQREIQGTNGFTISDVIQTDAAVNPGNSGGPLLDMNGSVIGVNSQIATSSGGNVGIAFAIPSKTVQRVVNQIVEDGSASHAWLGIIGTPITETVAEHFNIPVKEGVLIDNVFEGSPADKEGLKAGDTRVAINGENYTLGGDIIVEFDGEKVTSMRQLVELVSGKQPGDSVEIVYYRGEDRKTATLKLGERPNETTETSR